MTQVNPIRSTENFTIDEEQRLKNGSSRTLKPLIAGVVVLALIVVSLGVALIVSENQRASLASSSKSAELKAPETKCLNKACVEAAFRIQQNMDTSVKPCENFYRFSCGGWEKRAVISEASSSISTFNKLRDEVVIAVKQYLEQPETAQDIPTTRQCKRFYSSCMNRAKNEQQGVASLQTLAKIVGGLPIITVDYLADQIEDKNRTFEEIYSSAALHSSLLRNPFSFSFSSDAKDSNKYLLEVDQPSGLGLPSFDMYKNQTLYSTQMTAYKTMLKNFVNILQEDFNTTLENGTDIIERVVQFETTLAKASVKSGLRRNINDYYNVTTLDNLQKLFPMFEWKNFMESVFNGAGSPVALENSVAINLASFSFFSQVKNELFDDDAKVTVSYMHLFSAITNTIKHLPKRYRKVYADYREVITGTSVETPRFKECHDLLNGFLPHAVGRIFIDSEFPEEAKKELLDMINMIRNSFKSLVDANSWMDQSTKIAAVEKLNLMKNKIAYPDWTRDNKKLQEYYKDINLNTAGSVIEHSIALLKWSKKQSLKKYGKPVNKEEWITGAAIVNAFYMPPYNTINFPAAILQPPFFHKNYPRHLNYGAVGMVIGHEITHGFDDQGRQRDGNGNFRQWWKPEVVNKFKSQAQCLINQYGNFTAPNNMKLNGIQTQGENIADNGGIKQSFKAYRDWVKLNKKEELTLPGLNLTGNQLFFVNFASIWCHKNRMANWRDSILSGVHSPGRFRVIGSLQNSPDFQREFNCQKNDFMYKENKCSVW